MADGVGETIDSEPVDAPSPDDPGGTGDISRLSAGELPGSERYELIGRLGEGGAGEVWLARDSVLEREVALKILKESDSGRGLEQTRRFIFEAQTSGRLGHPGIVPVHDIGMLPDGRWFYTMRQIQGSDFRDILNRLTRGEKETREEYPLTRRLAVYADVCMTMAYAHDRGIIHRDLKPGNILLGSYGEVYVCDWGLAKFYRDEDSQLEAPQQHTSTAEGSVMGTASFMSPEQVEGRIDELGPPSDVFSLGSMLYELLTLRVPFRAPRQASVIFKITSEEPTDPRELADEREIPDAIADLTMEALEKEPEDRPSARELAERIQKYLEGVEERRRQRERARELLERGKQLREEYEELAGSVERARAELETELPVLDPNVPFGERLTLWKEKQELLDRSLEAEEYFSKAVQALRHSLDHHAFDEAREHLADLFYAKYRSAESDNDERTALYFKSLVEQYDRGKYQEELADEGTVDLRVEPEGARIRLERQKSVGPLLLSEDQRVDEGEQAVATGSYVADIQAPGRVRARAPFVVEGGERTEVGVDPPELFEGHEEFCFVPGGEYPVGGDPDAYRSLKRQIREVDPFLIAETPVTVREYCEFLDDVARRDFDRARQHSPRTYDGSAYYLDIDERERTFSAPDEDPDGDPWDPEWPIIMINWHDARAYCQWRSEREDATYRLPSEIEWEIAARGVDERYFPWGNGFDPTLCRMVETMGGDPKPSPVGSNEHDCSPFSAYDMAGQVIEWTNTEAPNDTAQQQFIVRGGGFRSPAIYCRVASRKWNQPTATLPQLGFRIVRTVST
ncbi:MAG: bifunctional serine/threonine-protein kinase/formylglycine-generating enzyme family protein [Bradymonadaceae bacterium]